jgi:hypothetical protein
MKHEKGFHSRFSDDPQLPPKKNLAKTPRTPRPLDFQLLYIYAFSENVQFLKEILLSETVIKSLFLNDYIVQLVNEI